MGRVRRVSERADVVKALSYYGNIRVTPNGMFSCPFHGEDKHPSAQVRGNRWKCYACGAFGDAIDFVAQLQGIDVQTAAKIIDTDFGLGVYSKEMTPEELQQQVEADRSERQVLADRAYYKLRLEALGRRYKAALDGFVSTAPTSVKDLSSTHCNHYASASIDLEILTDEIFRTEELLARTYKRTKQIQQNR